MRRSSIFSALWLVIFATLVACEGVTESGGNGGSCELVARFRGHSYTAVGVEVAPDEGEPLGAAVLPGCNDTGEANESSAEQIQVARLPGVSPDIALVWAGRGDVVLVRESVSKLPGKVTELQHAPDCAPRDAPIKLAGPWLGILGADGKTEVDLEPPYDVDLIVEDASTPRYIRAFLTVRVPSRLGRPLSRNDVQSSLAEGGSIEIMARCDGRRYVSEDIRAYPSS